MQQLLFYDKELFKLINYKWHNSLFDNLLPWLRNANIWAALYIFIVVFMSINYKKIGWWWILFFILTVVISNYLSSNIFKENFIRLRPCNDTTMAGWIRVLVGYRPQSSSFTSSHAANHFAMATFIYTTLKNYFGKWVQLFFLWAFAISYAQVYVGVHYPLDVVCGALIGIIIGYLCGKIFIKNFTLV